MIDNIVCQILGIAKSLECAVCLDLLKEPVSTGCGHFFCKSCLTNILQTSYRQPCPLCKRPFTRRGIQDTPQREIIVCAAKDLIESCEKFTGRKIVSQECSSTEIGKEKFENKVAIGKRTKKRKSSELEDKERQSAEKALAHEEKAVNGMSTENKEVDEVSENKRPRTSVGSEESCSDDELPDLFEFFNVKNAEIPSQDYTLEPMSEFTKVIEENPGRVMIENISISNTTKKSEIATSDEVGEEKNLKIQRKCNLKLPKLTSKSKIFKKNLPNALQNKTNQSLIENFTTSGNKALVDKIADKSKIFDGGEIEEIVKENSNKQIDLFISPSRKTRKKSVRNALKDSDRPTRSKKSETEKKSAVNILGEKATERALVDKITSAEKYPLTVTYSSPPKGARDIDRAYDLPKVKIPSTARPISVDRDFVPETIVTTSKCFDLPDTAVSVQNVSSPENIRVVEATKSPGWSRVKKVEKDFRMRNFSRLSVAKNSSASSSNADSGTSNSDERPLNAQVVEIFKGIDTAGADNGMETNLEEVKEGTVYLAVKLHGAVPDKAVSDCLNCFEASDIMNNEVMHVTEEKMEEDNLFPKEENEYKNNALSEVNSFISHNPEITNLSDFSDTNIAMDAILGNTVNQALANMEIPECVPNPNIFVPDKETKVCEQSEINNLPQKFFNYNQMNSSNLVDQVDGCGVMQDNVFTAKLSKSSSEKEKHVSVAKVKDGALFTEHSQQTSQQYFGISGNINRNEMPTSNAIPQIRTTGVLEKVEVAGSSEKTKVVKRTCLTLDEIQDSFSLSSRTKKPEIISVLPFLNGEYKLHIGVSEDTLNISVLKVVDFEMKNNSHTKGGVLLVAEKNIQTSRNNSPVSLNKAIFQSSNPSSQTENMDFENRKLLNDRFPYLNKLFVDSEPFDDSEVIPLQLDAQTSDKNKIDGNNGNSKEIYEHVIDTYPVDAQNIDENDVHVEHNVEHAHQKESDHEQAPRSHDGELKMPTLDLTDSFSANISPPNDEDNQPVVYLDKISDQEVQKLLIHKELFGDSDSLEEKNEGVPTVAVGEEVFEIGTTPEKDLEDHRRTEALQVTKATESRIGYSDPFLINISPPHVYPADIEDLSNPEVSDLVDPFETLARVLMKRNENSLCTAESGTSKTLNKSQLDNSLSSKLDSSKYMPEDRTLAQKPSRLSLKAAKSTKKFRRINKMDSDDEDDDEAEKTISSKQGQGGGNQTLQTTVVKENKEVSKDHSFFASGASDEFSNANSHDVAMELDNLDDKIKSVVEKLKGCGQLELFEELQRIDANVSLKRKSFDDDHSDGEDSDDIFSVPPTPPKK